MLTGTCFFKKAFLQSLRGLESQQKRELLKIFWPEQRHDSEDFDVYACDAFLEHIINELEQVRAHQDLFVARNFDETSVILQVLKENISKPCKDIVHKLSAHFNDAEPAAIRRSLELSARLWSTFNTHSSEIAVGPIFADELPLDWHEDASLEYLCQTRFAQRSRQEGHKGYLKIDPAFTAAYLVNTCGMKLQWTDNIAGHLKFNSKRVLLTVYRHKACIASHLYNESKCPIPGDVLGEVLDTLNLLFPFADPATKQLLLKEGQRSLFTLGACKRHRKLDLAQYQHFGNELEHLIDSFDKSPRTWKQLAFDRRNKLEWSAFWVTVMVGVLTFVSIPCNIIQATYSVKAYHATLAQGVKNSTIPT